MVKRETRQTRLRLVQGGLQSQCWFHAIHIVAASEKYPPFEVEARAFEEDTFLIMSARPTVCAPPEHPIRLMTDLINIEPERLGSIRIQGGKPLRLLAIVHDVNQEPTWRTEWIKNALIEIWREVERRKLASIGIPPLGMLHGHLELPDFVDLFANTIMQVRLEYLKRIWVITPADATSVFMDMLKAILTKSRIESTKSE